MQKLGDTVFEQQRVLRTATLSANCVFGSSILSSAKGLRDPTKPEWTRIILIFSANIFLSRTGLPRIRPPRCRHLPSPIRLTAAKNLGYYSEQEFDFSPYDPSGQKFLNLAVLPSTANIELLRS